MFFLVLPVLYDGENIEFTYDASGVKLRKYIEDSETTTDYAGNFVYIDDQLAYILTSEGRIVPLDTDYNYEYHLRDHLGNTRVVFLVLTDEGIAIRTEVELIINCLNYLGKIKPNSAVPSFMNDYFQD